MNIDKKDLALYAITDRKWLNGKKLEDEVEKTINGGATFVQLREKNTAFEDFVDIAYSIKEITDKYKVPFVINDNIEVAIKVDADGVHVGQSDMNAKDVRSLLGKDKILGVSAKTVEEALLAQKNGANYIGVGAVFSTNTKLDADNVSFDTLEEICKAVDIPVVVIGGIDETNILKLKPYDIDGICVISAIFSKENIFEATKNLKKMALEVVGGLQNV